MGALGTNVWLAILGLITILSLAGLFVTRTSADWEGGADLSDAETDTTRVEGEEEYLARLRAQDSFDVVHAHAPEAWNVEPDDGFDET